MSRDPSKLQAFNRADDLVVDVYRATRTFPSEERFGLQSQLRRGAISVTANLVEGCARPTQRDYLRFVSIAIGSASEVRYLITLATRLGFLDPEIGKPMVDGYGHVIRALQSLISTLSSSRGLKPEV